MVFGRTIVRLEEPQAPGWNADTPDMGEQRVRPGQGGRIKVSDSMKARVFRGAITASSLVALAIAAGAGRKFS
jgi:hypothetical protein